MGTTHIEVESVKYYIQQRDSQGRVVGRAGGWTEEDTAFRVLERDPASFRTFGGEPRVVRETRLVQTTTEEVTR